MTTSIPSITYNWEEYVLGNEYTAGTGISISSNVVSNTWVTSVNWNTGEVTGLLTSSNINNTAYGSSWDWKTTTAPSKNAVYDKISAMDTTISGKLDAETVVSWDSGTTYTIKVANADPSWETNTTITFVV